VSFIETDRISEIQSKLARAAGIKQDPYGRNVPSSIPVPDVPGGWEFVPAPGLPAEYPAYLKPIPINTRNVLAELRSYLNVRTPKVARWLYSTWGAEADAIKYQELRNALRDGECAKVWIERWQQDYARFVNDVLDPQWREAFEIAGMNMEDAIRAGFAPGFGYDVTDLRILEWIETRGGELAVSLSEAQHRAIRNLIRHFTIDTELAITADELGRILRPAIGLTPNEAEAVRRFQAALIEAGELTPAQIIHQVENYAGFLHRRRGLRIAQTELAYSYNFGLFESVRQANEQSMFAGPVVKEWATAEDERVCPFCGPLDGVMIGLESTFPGRTEKVPFTYVPPGHPKCRCSVIYNVLLS